MRRGWVRRVVAAAPPVFVIASAWGSLQTGGAIGPLYAVAVLPLLTALPSRFPVRLLAGTAMLVGLTAVSAGSSTSRVRDVTDRGLSDIYATGPPFDSATHHELYVLVVIAAAAFCLAVAVTAGSRPFVAAALIAVGIGWPTTMLESSNTVATGALCLVVALWPIVVTSAGDRREVGRGVWGLVGVTAVAVVAVGVGGAGRSAAVNWRAWDLFGQTRVQRTVALVWDSNYNGVDFPKEKTTVLRITAPHRALYWRATTLDLFSADRWVESLYTTDVSGGNRRLPDDGLLPAAAVDTGRWVRQEVDVRAVVDDHLVGANQPMRIAAGAGHAIRYQSGGVMQAPNGLAEMRRYTVWSYWPRPTPAQLVRSPPTYPRALVRYLDVGGATVPTFDDPKRTATVSSLLRSARYEPLWPYKPLWSQALRVTAGARSPYQATLRIERWLRTDGGFVYDEHPPLATGMPPLVGFVARTKLGYCQQFAGSMALMLRYLGIPARVAVGFTSGTWKDGTWTVTDHEAHAWVEAWFAGYGWVTFDPTPGRGGLTDTYTNASDSADAIRALGTEPFLGNAPKPTGGGLSAAPVSPPKKPTAGRTSWPYGLPAVVLIAALLGLAAVKHGRRVRRGATQDPRALASAARLDLVEFLRDQGSQLAASAPLAELVADLRQRGVAADGFAAAFSRARYGRPEKAPAAAAETRLERGRIVALLRDRVGAARRVRGFLALKSLRGG